MLDKVIVLGCPGSGKSYFSKRLHEITGIPVFYLDKLYWKKDWKHVSDRTLKFKIKKILEGNCYIIDGNYFKTIKMRLDKAEQVFYFDIPTRICLDSVKKRENTVRDDFPNFLNEVVDEEFIEMIKNFKSKQGKFILELLHKYKHKEIHIFKNRKDAKNFLSSLKKQRLHQR